MLLLVIVYCSLRIFYFKNVVCFFYYEYYKKIKNTSDKVNANLFYFISYNFLYLFF